MSKSSLIDVDLSINPEVIHPNETITFATSVKQNGKSVKDADKVKYEIWKDGADKSNHHSIDVKDVTNDQYVLKTTLAEPGKYFVIVHVTAHDAHNMPKKSFVVVK